MKLRTPLFAPADSPRKIAKALASAADCVILDLEDSVAEGGKIAARATAAAALRGAGDRDVIVRINPRRSAFYLGDLAAIIPAAPGALLLPKCETKDDLTELDAHLDALETAAGLAPGSVGVLALVTETAPSVLALSEYRHGLPRRVRALCFGAEDLSADLGVDPRGPDDRYPAAIAHARSATLLAAAAAGIPALDTPFPDPRDPAGLARETAMAVADGFAGKLLIHPDQIATVAEAFTPPPARVAWARAVVAAFEAAPQAGVLSLDGKMLDRPHLRLARRILGVAG